MAGTTGFIERLDEAIAQRRMLDHPLYKCWSAGALSREALREYAKQYYHFVQAFPTLISATHANTPVLAIRQQLLENLIEEERGDGNHPGLWAKFVNALGISEAQAASAPLLPETEEALDVLFSITKHGSFIAGIGALYAYESQIPEIANMKIEGLQKFYGISDAEALSFFTVHKEAEIHHSASERRMLAECVQSEQDEADCLAGANASAGALLTMLDGIYREFVQTGVKR